MDVNCQIKDVFIGFKPHGIVTFQVESEPYAQILLRFIESGLRSSLSMSNIGRPNSYCHHHRGAVCSTYLVQTQGRRGGAPGAGPSQQIGCFG